MGWTFLAVFGRFLAVFKLFNFFLRVFERETRDKSPVLAVKKSPCKIALYKRRKERTNQFPDRLDIDRT